VTGAVHGARDAAADTAAGAVAAATPPAGGSVARAAAAAAADAGPDPLTSTMAAAPGPDELGRAAGKVIGEVRARVCVCGRARVRVQGRVVGLQCAGAAAALARPSGRCARPGRAARA
jgi:hypothetical protein